MILSLNELLSQLKNKNINKLVKNYIKVEHFINYLQALSIEKSLSGIPPYKIYKFNDKTTFKYLNENLVANVLV